MKIKLFSHCDLDGIGCGVVANVAFGKENVDSEFCDYKDINNRVHDFFLNVRADDYDRVFITDISVNEELAELINNHPYGKQRKVQLIDHHATAIWLSDKYSWAEVRTNESNLFPESKPEREKVESSGTSLFYKFLRNKNIPKINANPRLKAFAETVRKYDTWNWHNIYNDDHPKHLNDLLYIVGREKFLDRFSNDPFPMFTETELTLLEVEQHRINKYIWYKKQDVKEIKWNIGEVTYNVAYVFAEQHSSLLGNAIAEELKDRIDFVVIIDVGNSKVSLRGVHDHIDLGRDVAKYMGGGGHPKASGFEFSDSLRSLLLLNILGVDTING